MRTRAWIAALLLPVWLLVWVGLSLWGCASGAPSPQPGRAQVWGRVTLVPHDGLPATSVHASAYGDRRLRDASLVDYSQPGFAIVHRVQGPAPRGDAEIVIRDGPVGTRFEPDRAAMGTAGRLVLRNASASAHVVSLPASGRLVRILPDETFVLGGPEPGGQRVFLLDVPDVEATLFAAPGAFVRVGSSGRYVLPDLPPGRQRIRVWHPRFPPVTREVEVGAGGVVRLDLELGVGRAREIPDAR